jgi:hypothetical protein
MTGGYRLFVFGENIVVNWKKIEFEKSVIWSKYLSCKIK